MIFQQQKSWWSQLLHGTFIENLLTGIIHGDCTGHTMRGRTTQSVNFSFLILTKLTFQQQNCCLKFYSCHLSHSMLGRKNKNLKFFLYMRRGYWLMKVNFWQCPNCLHVEPSNGGIIAGHVIAHTRPWWSYDRTCALYFIPLLENWYKRQVIAHTRLWWSYDALCCINTYFVINTQVARNSQFGSNIKTLKL